MKAHGDYHDQGYAHLEALIPGEVARAFLQRLKTDLRDENISLNQFAKSSNLTHKAAIEIYGYSYKPMIHFLWGLTPTMCTVTGLDLLPTYSFFRIYQHGDICRVHSDRDACQHSLSLTLAYSDDMVWEFGVSGSPIDQPLKMTESFEDEPFTTISMQPGDAVLYQGIIRRHGRVKPNPNRWSAHMFLHWVERDGPYSSSAFDGMVEIPDRVDFFQ